VFHWLGVTRIHRFASMSDEKHDALVRQGIRIDERIPIPDDRIPADARVEIEAKIAAGYFDGGGRGPNAATVGRALDD
jgi:GTP cyclohydrolase II